MKKLYLLMLACLLAFHGFTEQVEAGSTGNKIVFAINNISSETISNATIEVENSPSWLTFEDEFFTIGSITARSSTQVEFEFSVSSSANGSGNVSFVIYSDGLVWNTSSNAQLNIAITANPIEVLAADFTASSETGSPGTTIQFYNASSGDPTSFSWSFPGGTPTTSTAQNPSVSYNNEGNYNVTLTVGRNGSTDFETKYNFISILQSEYVISGHVENENFQNLSNVKVEYKADDTDYESGSVLTNSSGNYSFSVSSGWEGKLTLTKAGYGSWSQDVGPVYANTVIDDRTLWAANFDFTWELSPYYKFDVYITPNPTNELLNFELSSDWFPVTISLYDINGKRILENKYHESGQIDIHGLKGVFLLKAQNHNKQVVKKIICN